MSAVAIRPGQPQTDQKNRTNLALDLTAKPVSRTSSTSQPAAPGKTTITTESQSNDPGKNGGLPLTSPTMVPSPNASPTVGGTANTLQEGATNEAEAPITQPIMTEGMKQALELNSMYEQTYIQARVDEAASENLARRWEAQQLRISLAKHLQVQTQIIEQMKVQLDSKHATITRLKLETKESEEALDKDMDEYQATGTRMVLTYSEEKQAMSNRIEHLRRKNAEVDKYSREKDALARQLAQYEATLKAEVAAVKRKLQESAIHHRLAKDALKHEIVSKVKQRKVEKLEEAMREMPFKTRQARAYIEDTTAELQVQSSALSRLTQASVRGEVHRRILSERYTIARRDAQRISGRTYLLKSLLAKLKIRACEMYQSLVAATRERDATPEWNMDMTGYNPLTNSTLSSLSDKGAVSLPSIRRTGVGEYTAAMNTLNNEELPSQHAAALSLRGLESRLNQLNEQVRSAHSDLIAAQQHASDVSESAQFALSHLNESSRVILAALADACKSLRQRRLEQRQTSMLHKYDHGITSKSCASLLRSPALTDGLAPVYVSDFHVALSGSPQLGQQILASPSSDSSNSDGLPSNLDPQASHAATEAALHLPDQRRLAAVAPTYEDRVELLDEWFARMSAASTYTSVADSATSQKDDEVLPPVFSQADIAATMMVSITGGADSRPNTAGESSDPIIHVDSMNALAGSDETNDSMINSPRPPSGAGRPSNHLSHTPRTIISSTNRGPMSSYPSTPVHASLPP